MQYGYIRVSSTGQNVARQVDALHEAGIADDQIFIDMASGKDFDRPAWKRLIRKLKAGDMIVIQSLDRLGRNYEDILEQWRILIKVKGVDIRVLNMPLLDTANKACGLVGKLVADLVLQLFSFVAESERANIKERQRQGIDAAKKRGVKFGRPEVGNAEEIARCVERIKDGGLSIGTAAKICRVSSTTIRRRINQKQPDLWYNPGTHGKADHRLRAERADEDGSQDRRGNRLVDPGPNVPSVWTRAVCHYEAHQQCIQGRRITQGGFCANFAQNLRGGRSSGCALQP